MDEWFIVENPIKLDDMGGNPLFSETPICLCWRINYESTLNFAGFLGSTDPAAIWLCFWNSPINKNLPGKIGKYVYIVTYMCIYIYMYNIRICFHVSVISIFIIQSFESTFIALDDGCFAHESLECMFLNHSCLELGSIKNHWLE